MLKEVPGIPEAPSSAPENVNRLAVVFSAPFGWSADTAQKADATGLSLAYHAQTLQCAVTLAKHNLAQDTPADIFVVATLEVIRRDGYPGWMRDLGVRVYPQEDLAVPVGAPDAVADHPLARSAT